MSEDIEKVPEDIDGESEILKYQQLKFDVELKRKELSRSKWVDFAEPIRLAATLIAMFAAGITAFAALVKIGVI